MGLDGLINTVNLDNKPLPISLITNVDHMARRAISHEMQSIILRSSIRAIAKGAAQKAVQDNASSAGMFGAVLSIGASVAAVVSEKADERSWRSLPAFYSVGRVVLTPGTHTLTLNTTGGTLNREIQVSGKHAVVVVRGTGNSLYLAQTPYTPAPSPVVTAPEPAIKPVARKKPAEPIKPLAKEGTK